MTEFKKINELDRINSLSDTDLFVVETATGTKAITRSAFKEEADIPTKEDIGLGNVDNTSDLEKPVSTAVQTELNKKLDISTFNTSLSDYLTISDASDTYLTKNNASGTYLSKTEAVDLYVTKSVFNEALAGLEQLLSEV